MEILSTREWAIAIWVMAIIAYLVFSPKTNGIGEQFKGFLKAFFVRPIISTFLLMTIYVVIVVNIYSQVGIWEWHQLKNTIFWYFSIAAISLLKINSVKESPNYLKDSVINNIKLIGVIEFLTNVYTFNIFIELILVPILFILGAMLALAQNNKEHNPMEGLLNWVLGVVGSVILVFTVYMMVTNFGELATEEKAYDFFVPPILTLAYIPFMMFMVMYTTYENVFRRLHIFVKGGFLRFYAKLITMIRFNFRTELLERWASGLAIKNVFSLGDINQSVSQIFEMVKIEKNPPKIDSSKGWSPYEAKDYLVSEGVITRHYHPVDEKEWWCGSNSLEFGEGLFKNNIEYYVSGDFKHAKHLKIFANVHNPEESELALNKFISSAKLLIDKALGIDLPRDIEALIHVGNDGISEVSGVEIKFYKTIWPNHTFNGYHLGFVISRI